MVLSRVWEKVSLRALVSFGQAVHTDAQGQVCPCPGHAAPCLEGSQLSSGLCAVATLPRWAPAARRASSNLCSWDGLSKSLRVITELHTLHFTNLKAQQGAGIFSAMLCQARSSKLHFRELGTLQQVVGAIGSPSMDPCAASLSWGHPGTLWQDGQKSCSASLAVLTTSRHSTLHLHYTFAVTYLGSNAKCSQRMSWQGQAAFLLLNSVI